MHTCAPWLVIPPVVIICAWGVEDLYHSHIHPLLLWSSDLEYIHHAALSCYAQIGLRLSRLQVTPGKLQWSRKVSLSLELLHTLP